MNVITGYLGFIGSHLLEALPDAVGVDKRHSGWENQDLSDPYYKWTGGEVDTLYHLAADPLTMFTGNWLRNSEATFKNNAIGTYNAIREMNPKRIVFTSTANVYGEGLNRSEKSPIVIGSPYGYSKIVAEEIVKRSGIPCLIVRLGTVVGPRGRTFPNRMVWSVVHGKPVDLFCSGMAKRSLIDVSDVVNVLTALKTGLFNVAAEKFVTGWQLTGMVTREAEARGYKPDISASNRQPQGYVECSTLNTDLLTGIGWTPRVGFAEMIKRLFDYYESADAVEPPSWEAS